MIGVLVLLTTQAGLLAYSATRHSPTHLEPAFLAAGISHWQAGKFELYRVNPPLPRMIAALPVMAVGCETDWHRFYDGPGSRAEFSVGEDFIKANGRGAIALFIYARWACIPFALVGAYFAYRWAKDLYGSAAGLLTLVLWTFEPNLIAHAELVTPDSACISFGIAAGYWFWRWLSTPNWRLAVTAGMFLGLAQLAKMTWLILFVLWPVMWIVWRSLSPEHVRSKTTQPCQNKESSVTARSSCVRVPHGNTLNSPPSGLQLAAILILGLYLLNLGYAFDGTFTPLKDFQFVSTSFTALKTPGKLGNRFRESVLGQMPMPVPKQFLLGFDSQKRDFEDYGEPSYLRGEWKDGGWWYYYIYGLLVKVPCSNWGLFVVLIICRFHQTTAPFKFRDELLLIAPAVFLLLLVSSQTEINQHLRYVFPSMALMLIWLGQAAVILTAHGQESRNWSPRLSVLSPQSAYICITGLVAYSIASTMLVYPHQIAYFNDFIGGPANGWKHLLGSSFDWGQDLLLLEQHLQSHPIGPAVAMVSHPFPPGNIGIQLADPEFTQDGEIANQSYDLPVSTELLVNPRARIRMPDLGTTRLVPSRVTEILIQSAVHDSSLGYTYLVINRPSSRSSVHSSEFAGTPVRTNHPNPR
ncbi:MAG: glycosyltransferase family 39 protein [Planctomycetes bacterium]|nr:glycosyltransferase family 39 protein [Planctomycetota bacterium]